MARPIAIGWRVPLPFGARVSGRRTLMSASAGGREDAAQTFRGQLLRGEAWKTIHRGSFKSVRAPERVPIIVLIGM